MTAHYSYLATDLVSGSVLGELTTISGVALDCQLNNAGNMSAGAKLDDPRIDNEEFLARTTPGKTAFWAFRESQIVWGGAVLSRVYQAQGKAISLTGQTFECYAARRFPRSVIGTIIQNLSMGQSAMIDYLWKQLQSTPNGSIGVLPAVLPSVDPNTTLTVNGYDLSTSYAALILRVTQLSGGPDWTIAWGEDGFGNPTKQLVCGAPIGNPVGTTDLQVDFPGSPIDYTYTENASGGANQWWATGDGTDAAITTGEATDSVSLASDYPLWESVNSYQGVSVQSTIDAHASSDLASKPMPLVTHTLDLSGTEWPIFGSYGLGDYAVVNITDSRFPRGETFSKRVIGWTIQPPDENQGSEKITLVFDEPTASVG